MSTINERMRTLRSHLGLTQEVFGANIGLSIDEVKNIEYGRTNVKDRIIPIVCRTYKVNKEWLVTGQGKMIIEHSMSEEISAFMGDIFTDDSDFRQRLISALAKMTPDEWAMLEKVVRTIVE